MAFNCGSIFIILIIWPLIWAADSVEPSFDHQLTSHEIKTDDNGKQRIVDGLSYLLDNPRSSSSQLTGSSSSSTSNSNLYDDLYGNRGNNYLSSSEDNNNNLIDSVFDQPGKRKFIPLRGRKESELPVYHYYYPGINSFNDGYRKKAAFTGMRGKKMDSRINSNQLNHQQQSTGLTSRQIFGSLIADLPWVSLANLNDPNGLKRSRPFSAMRGKRST
ncbi:uncharacterized protein LOC128386950 [Panonychus citri]|uniref:uncharacterized protein LOC128386950 n=1 Tax=Panonychus citri TaxID=50023 RepID=UPI0023071806|nr:uncharacterized protein LOC128386950 [Panonychus citri]